ncbi:hypothetical protein F5Y08DRAFT_323057 [Xylaria arbuscula]|nr:hypothetical protein F5Y08DRAFT_323057 [Xylaria arbuscula]
MGWGELRIFSSGHTRFILASTVLTISRIVLIPCTPIAISLPTLQGLLGVCNDLREGCKSCCYSKLCTYETFSDR